MVRVLNADPTTSVASVDVNGRPVVVEYGSVSPPFALGDGTLRVGGPPRRPEQNSLTTVVRTASGVELSETCLAARPDPRTRLVRAVVAPVSTANVAVSVDGTVVGAAYAPVGGAVAVVTVNGVTAGSARLEGSPLTSHWTVLVTGGGDYGWRVATFEDAAVAPAPPDPRVPIETGLTGDRRWGPAAAAAATLALLVATAVRWRRRALAVLLVAITAAAPACNAGAERQPARRLDADAPAVPQPDAFPDVGRVDRVTISAIGLDRVIEPIPEDVASLRDALRRDQLGWLTSTASMGSLGIAVVVGHRTGRPSLPGVLERLAEVEPGARLTTHGETTVEWVAIDVATYPKGALPEGFFGPRAVPTLGFISCTQFDGATHRQNVVVSFVPARLVV